jgi:hypothetical protein
MPLHPQHRRQRAKNVALGLGLGALVVLFFAITIAKMSGGS